MFKFLRKYNKIILVVGAAFLMVAFLIQPVLSMFMTGPGDRTLGTIDGEELTALDRNTATAELTVLQRVNPLLGNTAMQGMAGGDALKWLLMVRDARQMGLSASRQQVMNVLAMVGSGDTQRVNQIANEAGVSDDMVYQAVRHWIMLQEYQSLVLGQQHMPAEQWLQTASQFQNLMIQMQQTEDFRQRFQLQMQAMQMRGELDPSVRLSEPLLQWFLANRQSTVAGKLLVIDADYYLGEVDAPTDAELRSLFEEYRDDLPGEGEPYGFGYKYPDRVKLEWLSFPVDKLRDHVQVDYADKLAYYDENKAQFRVEDNAQSQTQPVTQPQTQPESDEPEYKPFQDVFDTVTRELRTQRAESLAQDMVSSAQAMLLTDARQLDESNGYRQVTDDFTPTSLDEIADRLEEEFGVRPNVVRRTQRWVPTGELSALPGIGRASLVDRGQVGFTSYVQSVRELEPDPTTNALVAMHLQAQLPSRPMVARDGSRYLFRITDAQPTHAPESMGEVREQLVRDGRRRKAYDMLQKDRDKWQQRAVREGFGALAEQEHISQHDLRPTPRRRPNRQTGELSVPPVPGVGRNERLVEQMFDVAERVSERGRRPVSDVPESERSGVAAVDNRLSLAVFLVNEYSPVTRSAYEQQARGAQVESWLNRMMLGNGEADGAMSFDAVAQRVGFERTGGSGQDGGSDSPQQPQRRPGQI